VSLDVGRSSSSEKKENRRRHGLPQNLMSAREPSDSALDSCHDRRMPLVTNTAASQESPDGTRAPRNEHTVALNNGCSSNAASQRFEQLRHTLTPLRHALLNHPIYAEVGSLSRLREFMQMHVFAVWDFMSLVKRLQSELTSNSLPWTPPVSARIARFTNEVVLGEESDLGPDEKPISHFKLYLRAMDEIGADTTEIRGFTAQLALGARWEDVLADLSIAPGVRNFVAETLDCAIHRSIVEVAAFFFFGREDVIPEMFERLLRLWGNAKAEVPHFAYYLERHIELDAGSHGPGSQEMLTSLAGQRESNWQEATSAAKRAITSRIQLWDSVRARLKDTKAKRQFRLDSDGWCIEAEPSTETSFCDPRNFSARRPQ
jgi:hypothetical protein